MKGKEDVIEMRLARKWKETVPIGVAGVTLIQRIIREFWEIPVKVVFLGVSQQSHYFWRWDDFHVSQLPLKAGKPKKSGSTETQTNRSANNTDDNTTMMATLKLSDNACASLLNQALGPSDKNIPFRFKTVSALETAILGEFSRDLLMGFKKKLIRQTSDIPVASATYTPPPLHFVWSFRLKPLQKDGGVLPEIGKVVFSVPFHVLRHQRSRNDDFQDASIPDDFFFHGTCVPRLFLGSTRITLNDLDQLETGDVVLLENSHVSQILILESVSQEKLPVPIHISDEQRSIFDQAHATQELILMDIQETQSQSALMRQALWDNLMIEVDAEFEPIKLSLKQIKQITEGLVIELGDLMHNRIRLQVEGKTLAWGELLIVDDQFAVRISQVEAAELQHSPNQNTGLENLSHEDAAALVLLKSATGGDSGEEDQEDFLDDDFDESLDEEKDEW